MKRLLSLILFCSSLALNGQIANSGEFIAVIGKATGSFSPDMITFNFSINVKDKKQLSAVEKLNNQSNKLIDRIVELGIDPKKIKLSNYDLSEDFDYSDNKRKTLGFLASESFEFDINYSEEKFNLIIDSISTTKILDISFTYFLKASDSLQYQVKYDLVSKASDDAYEIAKTLANRRGLMLGEIFSIEYTENISSLYGNTVLPAPPYPPMIERLNDDQPRISRKIALQQIKSEQEVRIVYKIKNTR